MLIGADADVYFTGEMSHVSLRLATLFNPDRSKSSYMYRRFIKAHSVVLVNALKNVKIGISYQNGC
jgi:hypothetical protein